MRLIFLDIDGVLNSHEYWHRRLPLYRGKNNGPSYMSRYYTDVGFDGKYEIDPEAVRLLNELIKRTDAYLVLSSTWRLGSRGPDRLDGLDFTKRALELNGFEHNDRFLGKTNRLSGDDPATGRRLQRGDEIKQWFEEWDIECAIEDCYPSKHWTRLQPSDPDWGFAANTIVRVSPGLFKVEDRKIDSFIILDDDSDMHDLLPRLVWTPCWTGLTPWKCEEAEAMLLDPVRVGLYSKRRTKEEQDSLYPHKE